MGTISALGDGADQRSRRRAVGVAQGTGHDGGDLVRILDDLAAATDEQWEDLPASIAESGLLDPGAG